MRNFTTRLIASAILAASPSLASAWGTLENPSTIYSPNKEVSMLQSARTSDGKTYISWLQWSEQPGWGYDLYLQLLDENGKPIWDEESLAVETQRNASWSSDYSLVVTPSGDAILSWADARSEEDAEYAQGHEPVIYRINQNQEYVWGDEGITFDSEFAFPPSLYVFGEDIYAILKSASEYGPSKIVRINNDGTLAFEPIEFAGQLVPTEGNDFIRIFADSKGTVAMRYNRDIEPAWNEQAVISNEIYSGYASNPYKVCPDGQGGFAVTFARALDFTHLPIVNHITADGEATFGSSVDVIPEDYMHGDCDYPLVGVNTDTETILTIWNCNGDFAEIDAQKFDFFGERMFGDNGLIFAEKEDLAGYSYGPIALEPLNENEWFVCYADEVFWTHSVLHFACFDNDGKEIWNKSNPEPTNITYPSFAFIDGIFYITYISEETDEDWNKICEIRTIQFDALNTSGVDMINTPSAIGETEYYSISGVKLNHPIKGVNIVKKADGSTDKIFVK